jgi:hypothetical protein
MPAANIFSSPEVEALVRKVHGSPVRACVAVAGAGTLSLAWLFGVPGASRTMVDARVPYSSAALDEFVGERAVQHVSADEAVKVARAACRRVEQLSAQASGLEGRTAVGIGCTAAISTDRVRRGEERAHVAWVAGVRGRVYSLEFAKGTRQRNEEEYAVSALVLNALAEACDIPDRLDPMLLSGESLVIREA